VTLDENVAYNEMIYTPYLEIDYEEKLTSDILEKDEKFQQITFNAVYKMNTDGFWKLCRTIFWILLVVVFLSVLVFLNV